MQPRGWPCKVRGDVQRINLISHMACNLYAHPTHYPETCTSLFSAAQSQPESNASTKYLKQLRLQLPPALTQCLGRRVIKTRSVQSLESLSVLQGSVSVSTRDRVDRIKSAHLEDKIQHQRKHQRKTDNHGPGQIIEIFAAARNDHVPPGVVHVVTP
jgi:hypothetical protein